MGARGRAMSPVKAAGPCEVARRLFFAAMPPKHNPDFASASSALQLPPMDDFPIAPPLIVKDTPKPRRLATLEQARDYVGEALRLGRPAPWRELWHRLKAVSSEDEAIEAIGDMRELLADEDLLLPSDGPSPHER
jgi:hypothetical protein